MLELSSSRRAVHYFSTQYGEFADSRGHDGREKSKDLTDQTVSKVAAPATRSNNQYSSLQATFCETTSWSNLCPCSKRSSEIHTRIVSCAACAQKSRPNGGDNERAARWIYRYNHICERKCNAITPQLYGNKLNQSIHNANKSHRLNANAQKLGRNGNTFARMDFVNNITEVLGVFSESPPDKHNMRPSVARCVTSTSTHRECRMPFERCYNKKIYTFSFSLNQSAYGAPG